MNFTLTQRNRMVVSLAALAFTALAASGCTTEQTPLAAAQGPDTIALSPVVAGSVAPSVTEPAPTEAPASTQEATTTEATQAPTTATDAPTTEAPTTTAAPTTTEAPTTTAELPTTTTEAVPPNIEVVGAFPQPIVAVGSRSGPDTQVLQLRLLQLGFWHGGADGKYGLTTKQAVMAFQKYLRLPATGAVDADTAAWLTALDTKAHGLTDSGTLVEVDKGRQLIFFVIDGKTQWVFNTSTGSGNEYTEEDKNTPGEFVTGVSLTPDGLWNVNRERPEGWWEGDLGQIYRPKYFRGGVAIHGSNSVPNYPASHGCVRVTVQAMDFIWANNMMPMGLTVWVHP